LASQIIFFPVTVVIHTTGAPHDLHVGPVWT
jgi:hypothetical protein